MNDFHEKMLSVDNGGRRSGGDRRNFSYSMHIPERRSGENRRDRDDRRRSPRHKNVTDQDK